MSGLFIFRGIDFARSNTTIYFFADASRLSHPLDSGALT